MRGTKDRMLWGFKNSETAVGWLIGRDIIEAIKPRVCGLYKNFLNGSIFIFNYIDVHSLSSND